MDNEDFGLVEAASVGCKTMADGTLRISFDVEPLHAAAAFSLFGAPGSPSVLGRLKTKAEQQAPAPAPAARKQAAPRERMAPLCEWAVMRCAEEPFQQWCADRWDSGDMALTVHPEEVVPKTREEWAKLILCMLCEVSSRKELDTNPAAAKRFHERVRAPYADWLARQPQGVTA